MKIEIREGMARAFFAAAWADQREECGESFGGKEIMDLIPHAYDSSAWHAADTLIVDMERTNKTDVASLYSKHPGNLDAQTWGHYAAMQAMGSGVGLWDYKISSEQVQVPYVEFGSYSLQKDYFKARGEQ